MCQKLEEIFLLIKELQQKSKSKIKEISIMIMKFKEGKESPRIEFRPVRSLKQITS